MKTRILSIALLLVAVAGLNMKTYAAPFTTNYTILDDIKNISKIEVHGNVELCISNSSAEKVTVYNKYYSEDALVQNRNGVLRISSYGPEKLIVWVASENLRAVSAWDNAEVKSFGDVSRIDFSIDLHNNSAADLKFDAFSAHVNLFDSARIELSGHVYEFGVNRSLGSMVTDNDFSADHNTENNVIDYPQNVQVTGLE
ncbi:MAG TPA: DUF2807 domain-containing protein [Mucilaginibacter sp.]|nr:DUF2807 domain-containing protein [Mucilaginibacter sp.]